MCVYILRSSIKNVSKMIHMFLLYCFVGFSAMETYLTFLVANLIFHLFIFLFFLKNQSLFIYRKFTNVLTKQILIKSSDWLEG